MYNTSYKWLFDCFRMDPDMYVYHYTDWAGIEGIQDDDMISPSDPDRRDAYFGAGVYFTTVPSVSPTHKILRNNWDGVRRKGEFTEWFVAVRRGDLKKLRKVKAVSGMRDVWVTPEPVFLDEVHYAIDQRRV